MTLLGAHDHDLSELTALEWALVGLSALAVVWVIWRAVVLTLRPDEGDYDALKRSILDDTPPPPGEDQPTPPRRQEQ